MSLEVYWQHVSSMIAGYAIGVWMGNRYTAFARPRGWWPYSD